MTAPWTPPAAHVRSDAARALLADLRNVPALTDLPTSRNHALSLIEKVVAFDRAGEAGMLGRNGLAPAVEACVRGARAAGFDWRARA